MAAQTIDIHNHGYSKKFIEACRRGDGERYGIRLIADAKGVLQREFPDLAERIAFHIPDEKDKRHGQAVAAASLPKLK